MFKIGQLVPCCVVGLETTEPTKEHPKGRRRIELSLMPERVNARIGAADVREGMVNFTFATLFQATPLYIQSLPISILDFDCLHYFARRSWFLCIIWD